MTDKPYAGEFRWQGEPQNSLIEVWNGTEWVLVGGSEPTDEELEACCVEMKSLPSPLGIPFGEIASNALRAARRPNPPSLKEQALALINHDPANQPFLSDKGIDTIRRALEQLND